jgi:hypothetical protein
MPSVSLVKLVSALQFVEPGGGVRIDVETGEVVEDSSAKSLSEPTSSVSAAQSARFRTIALQLDELETARRFCESVADPGDRKRLETALASAQPTEAFENAVYRVGIAHKWFPFREAQLGDLAKAWLQAEGIPFVDDLT